MPATTNTYEVVIRGRLQNNPTAAVPNLAAANASTAVLDGVVMNGVDVALNTFAAGEISTLEAALKQAVIDKLD